MRVSCASAALSQLAPTMKILKELLFGKEFLKG